MRTKPLCNASYLRSEPFAASPDNGLSHAWPRDKHMTTCTRRRVTTTLARYWAAPVRLFILAFLFRGLSFSFCPAALPTLPDAQHSHRMPVTCMGVCMPVE